MADRCSKCGAQIRWIKTEKGRRMPLNVSPDPKGNVVVDDAFGTGRVLKKDESVPISRMRFMPHHATCEHAASFRRKGRKRP